MLGLRRFTWGRFVDPGSLLVRCDLDPGSMMGPPSSYVCLCTYRFIHVPADPCYVGIVLVLVLCWAPSENCASCSRMDAVPRLEHSAVVLLASGRRPEPLLACAPVCRRRGAARSADAPPSYPHTPSRARARLSAIAPCSERASARGSPHRHTQGLSGGWRSPSSGLAVPVAPAARDAAGESSGCGRSAGVPSACSAPSAGASLGMCRSR